MISELQLPRVLEESLQKHMDRTKSYFSELETKPEAVVLGGGYGRGEGGVYIDEENKPHFYNDLDYFIFCRDPLDAQLLNSVKAWEKEESKLLGIDVEGTCLVRSKLDETTSSMMFYDLVSAHKIVMGDFDYLDEYKALVNAKTIAPYESTRLLWNRGSGLFFAEYDLTTKGNLDVVHRNQSKAKLALGDSILALRGLYRPYVRERSEILGSQDDVSERIKALHSEGTKFKLRPTATPPKEVLLNTQSELSELWLDCFIQAESVRLNHQFHSAFEYSKYKSRIYPDYPVIHSLLLAARDRLKRGGFLRPVWDYPRGALQRVLVLLLDSDASNTNVARYFGNATNDISSIYENYRKWWHFYS